MKLPNDYAIFQLPCVTLRVRVWIETFNIYSFVLVIAVTLRVRVWIETN